MIAYSKINIGSISQLGNWIVERGVKAIWQEGLYKRKLHFLPCFKYEFIMEHKYGILNAQLLLF